MKGGEGMILSELMQGYTHDMPILYAHASEFSIY